MTTGIKKSVSTLFLAGVLSATAFGAPSLLAGQQGGIGCGGVGTPMAGMDYGMMGESTSMTGMHGGDQSMMAGSTPMAGMDQMQMQQMDFDLMYIDMMIPHHESVIALAEVAKDELSHPELIEIAERIVETQDAEIIEMRKLRDAWYPDADPVPMDMMMEMPGMGSDMDAMNQQMSSDWQVQSFCAVENKDLAFIEQVIPHHQMAIDSSMAADELAEHPELQAITERVIADQQHEIEELEAIRAELTGAATPSA